MLNLHNWCWLVSVIRALLDFAVSVRVIQSSIHSVGMSSIKCIRKGGRRGKKQGRASYRYKLRRVKAGAYCGSRKVKSILYGVNKCAKSFFHMCLKRVLHFLLFLPVLLFTSGEKIKEKQSFFVYMPKFREIIHLKYYIVLLHIRDVL